MRIRDLGVIEDAVLELGPGLTVITGETGAGKTMLLTGLGLLLGGRADPASVRSGAAAAVVEGRVAVPADSPVARRAVDAGATLDDDVLLFARTVSTAGRSRAHLGGRAVPAGVLAEVGQDLVAVHGQSDQQRLLEPTRQRAALDEFAGAGVRAAATRYAEAYVRWRTVEEELTEITSRFRERAQEADLLRFGLREIEAVDPHPGEDDELDAEAERLSHADVLHAAATQAKAALTGDPIASDDGSQDVTTLLGLARRALESGRSHDGALGELADRLTDTSHVVAELAADLASYAADVEADPARLAAVHDRRAALRSLTRKYGATATDVLRWSSEAAARLAFLETDDTRIEELRREREGVLADLAALAQELSSVRRAAGDRFAAAVADELPGLAMPHAQIVVEVTQRAAGQGERGVLLPDGRRVAAGPHGVDDVALLLAPHRGASPRPLGRGASGGELSRVMLAVEVVFAGADPVPTFVFDEVDAGVGGRAAVEVGRRLARLARSSQVIVVTHLPQVAAFADRHLLVVKSHDGAVTRSGVTLLDDQGRVRELSRMLAGLADSDTALAHAEELLATARATAST